MLSQKRVIARSVEKMIINFEPFSPFCYGEKRTYMYFVNLPRLNWQCSSAHQVNELR